MHPGRLRRGNPPVRRAEPNRGGPLRSRSKKKAAERAAAQPIVDQVYGRDGGCVLRHHQDVAGTCFGDRQTPHHLKKAGRGGLWTLANLVQLCEGHQSWVEDHPDEAHHVGVVVRERDMHAEAWARMRAAGLPVVAPSGTRCDGSGDLLPALHRGPRGLCIPCGQIVAVVAAEDGGPGAVLADHDLEGVA